MNLLSSFAALMEVPYVLKSAFAALTVNTYGMYMARLTLSGITQEIMADDFLPCDQNSRPLFIQATKRSEVWMLILTKCLAKLYGSYSLLLSTTICNCRLITL